MNQKILCHFEMMVNEKYYQFSFQPGAVNFDDLDNALMAFKGKIDALKQEAIAAEEAKKNEAPETQESEVAQ